MHSGGSIDFFKPNSRDKFLEHGHDAVVLRKTVPIQRVTAVSHHRLNAPWECRMGLLCITCPRAFSSVVYWPRSILMLPRRVGCGRIAGVRRRNPGATRRYQADHQDPDVVRKVNHGESPCCGDPSCFSRSTLHGNPMGVLWHKLLRHETRKGNTCSTTLSAKHAASTDASEIEQIPS